MIIIQYITQALILAGGEGTRLKPITENIPKPMVEIHGKPFLEYQLELLSKNGITEVVLCVGYLWEHFKEYFGESYTCSSGSSISLTYSVEPGFVGTGGAIIIAKKLLNERFFVIYGDSLLNIEYQYLGSLMNECAVLGVICVYNNKDKIVQNNMRVDNDGYISEYNKVQPTPEMNGVEAGVNVFSRRLLEYLPTEIPKNQKISLEVDIYPKLISQRKLLGFQTDNRFYDMGTFERLEIISEVLK